MAIVSETLRTSVEKVIEKFTFLLDYFFEIYNSLGDKIYYFYLTYSRTILNFMHDIFDGTFKVLIIITAFLATFYLLMGISVFFKKKRTEKSIPEGKEPFVTIQIPTYNELAAINCAKKCLTFDYPKNKFEIIIGDDSSDKTISAKIDKFAAKYKNQIKVTRRGKNVGFKPGNLNHMLKYSNGEYLVIFDSDFLPEKDFLKRIIAPFVNQKDISVVQSRWNIHNFSQNIYSVVGGTISLLCHNVALRFIVWIKGSSFLCGSAEAVRKADVISSGGWKVGALTEDIECSLRFIEKGKKLIYLEDLECKCEAPQTLGDLCKQQKRWAYGVIEALKEHFVNILKSKTARKIDKFTVLIFASGYVFSLLLFAITIFGMLSIFSNEPAPIDWAKFMSETVFNILITSGFLLASIISLYLAKKIKEIPRMVLGALSVGLVVTYNVNVGILKAMFNRQMQWFMLKKNGNTGDVEE